MSFKQFGRRRFLSSATTAATAFSSWPAGAVEPMDAGRKGLRAGAATVNITPALGTLMDGSISKVGVATHVHDELHARALVLDDGVTRLAIIVCDATMIGRRIHDAAKALIARHTKIPASHVLTAATHTHTSPRPADLWKQPMYLAYQERLAVAIADAVRGAVNRLAPAELAAGVGREPNFVRTRRFICKAGSVGPNPFGDSTERCKSVAGRSSAVIGPAGPVDPMVAVLSVRHADGTPLALLGNYNIHYATGGRRGHVSADYFGYFARYVEKILFGDQSREEGRPPFVGLMSNGNSASTGGGSMIPLKDPYHRMRVVGHAIAEEATRIYRGLQHRRDVTLDAVLAEVELGVRKPDEARITWAKQFWGPDGPVGKQERPHQWTNIFAREALYLADFPEIVSVPVQALRIGNLGITALPCEVFPETGLAIKAKSPLKPTFNIQLANGYNGYLPTPEQHAIGGYETWPARSKYLEVGAEPKLRAKALALLDRVAASGQQGP
ncbi:MAG: hypothetical protein OER86_01890 [Phycisphaerae bacterium]|nr:hypothetical protein [Phycisphaerae bacterium]